MKRVIFYFDGFNFYNGLREKAELNLQWKNYYWLNLVTFCNTFIDEGSELVKVKYFTSTPANKGKQIRQSAFLNVNKSVNGDKFEYINGLFINKEISCLATCGETFEKPEEKKTDVAISVNMLLDCFNDIVDTLVLITADTDQVPTIKAIKSRFPHKKVKVYFPPERHATEIFHLCKPVVYLGENEDKFQKSVFPNIVTVGTKTYTRPEKWQHPNI